MKQHDYLLQAKDKLGFDSWDEFAKHLHMSPRSFQTRRFASTARGFKQLTPIERAYIEMLKKQKRPCPLISADMGGKSQRDFLFDAKARLGHKTWDEFAAAVHTPARGFFDYRLPESSKGYRSMPSILVAYISKLLQDCKTQPAAKPEAPSLARLSPKLVDREVELAELYADGESLRTLGARYGVSHEVIRLALKALNIPLRGRGFPADERARRGKRATILP